MRVVIAPDKFKGSLSAAEAAAAMSRGLLRACPGASVVRVPMADGGEGTVDALVAATAGTLREAVVTGPQGEPLRAKFGLTGDGRTAVIEMAAASGLVLVPPNQRDPLVATTRGTGELILAAIAAGATRLIVGIGGSATNDGGAGLGQALGFRLLDEEDRDLKPGGGNLDMLARIDSCGRATELDAVEVAVACDVTNPLCGPLARPPFTDHRKAPTPKWSNGSTKTSRISPRSSSATWVWRSRTCRVQAPQVASEAVWSLSPVASCRPASSWLSRRSTSNLASATRTCA